MNQGNHEHSSPYLSRPTSYARYEVESVGGINPYPSGDHPSLNGHTYGYGYGEGGLRLPSENRELRLDRWSSTRRGYRDGSHFPSPQNRQFGLMDHPWSSFQDHSARTSSPSQSISFEETPTTRSSTQTRIPTNPHPVSRIPPQVVVSNVSRPRLAFSHRLTPRLSFNQGRGMVNTYTPPPDSNNESKLTKEEQEQVLGKLKKQIYNPTPTKVMPPRKVSLYYRDLNHNPSYFKDNKKLDEDGKRCAVCLEDFQAQDEVMITPCNHMFHEECIVPWVKSHGQCPLCRSVFTDRLKENATPNRNRPPPLPVAHSLFDRELLSLIQAVNEAFPWGA